MSNRPPYPDSLLDAFAQCLWIRLRTYLRFGIREDDPPWLCDFADLPTLAQSPLRNAARELLNLMFDHQDAEEEAADSTRSVGEEADASSRQL